MEGLFSLLMFAVFFYFMMRFGCGAHMIHGHHRNTDKNKSNSIIPGHTDPVCGMKVETDRGYGMMHEGELYRFCSRDCLDKFEASPRNFIHDQSQGE